MERFLTRHGYDFPVYILGDRSDVFSASPIPGTYIVDADGGIRAYVTGRLDWGAPNARAYLLALTRQGPYRVRSQRSAARRRGAGPRAVIER